MSDAPPPTLADFGHTRDVATRFSDNDVLGHLHNAVYYQAMDTTILGWLLDAGYLSDASPVAPVVASSSCRYLASGAFPDTLRVGLRVDDLSSKAITWGLGIFRQRDALLLATGSVVHVTVSTDTRRPVPVPDGLRARITAELAVPGAGG